jgi:twitching motility two-component system response regulator PilH
MAIKKILVVDDVPVYLNLLKKILQDHGFEVICATSGKEALEKAQTMRPHLIFMDIVMPDMDGFAACRELRKDELTRSIPIVIVSGKNQEVDRVWAELQGAKAYITKPYTTEQILDQVEAFK